MRTPLAIAVLASATCSLSAQSTATIVVDKDATLYESATGIIANGSGTAMFVGMSSVPAARRALLHFDVAASIPAGSRVLSAQLELSVQTSATPLPLLTDAHRLTQDWAEGPTVAPGGQGVGGPALVGDATWLHTSYQTTFWTSPGGDFVATPSFSFELAASGMTVVSSSTGLIDDVQTWLNNPSSNFGWLLKGDETLASTATKITTHESPNTSEHARLVISYLAPGEVGSWGTGCPVGSGVMTLTPVGVASGGALVPLNYTNAPTSSIGTTFFALGLVASGIELFPSCPAYLPLSGVIVAGPTLLTDAAGNGTLSFSVPVGFPGYLIVCQGAVLDSSPIGVTLSNASVMLTQ
jgi:hypothetical protein